jgi:hypothetical protein
VACANKERSNEITLELGMGEGVPSRLFLLVLLRETLPGLELLSIEQGKIHNGEIEKQKFSVQRNLN